ASRGAGRVPREGSFMRKTMLVAAVAAAAAGIGVLPALPSSAASPTAAHASRAAATIAVHFDLSKGQMPENVALGPDGTAYVTFAKAGQVAAVSPGGRVRILATLPAAANGGKDTPELGFSVATGIVRLGDGTIYFLYASGDAATTGLYRLRPGS